MEVCQHHDSQTNCINQLRTDIAVIRRDLEHVVGRICQHVEDAERAGGWRDRMVAVESDIRVIKEERIMMRWFMIGSGVIGGLLGSGATEAITKFLSLWH